MSDMPDEVLIDRRMHAWQPEDWHLLDRREGQVLFTRVARTAQDAIAEMAGRLAAAEIERDALADNQRCIACGGTGVDVERGDYGAQLGSDWCDSCEAGKALREMDERAEQAEAARDRLRAAARAVIPLLLRSDVPPAVTAAAQMLQEALSHD